MNQKNPKTIAIIPARGGSKGIPNKNIRPLCGKPLIAWTIEAALSAETVDRVVVSTDDVKIAEIGREYGAEIVMRPQELSTDTATSESALLHVLDSLEQTEDYHSDLLAFLQCTSPLTTPQDIDGTIQTLLEAHADTALTVVPFHYFIWKSNQTPSTTHNAPAIGINHNPSQLRQRRQDREPQYVETGSVYVMRTADFSEYKQRFFGKTVMHVIPEENCLEIDTPQDFSVAEVLMSQRLITTCQPSTKEKTPSTFARRLQAIILDFDGVLTDDCVYVDQDGKESVRCSRSDGYGILQLKRIGLPVMVLSREENPVVAARCEKLGVECIHGEKDKLQCLKRVAGERDWDLERLIFVGNDLPDIEVMQAVGWSAASGNAVPEVKDVANIVLDHGGGHGAVRELCDRILRKTTDCTDNTDEPSVAQELHKSL